jgi:hypothetical protein
LEIEQQNGQHFKQSGTTNQINCLEVRCPQCLKLYKVNTQDIHSSHPTFECRVCLAFFGFDYPSKTNRTINKLDNKFENKLENRVVARTLKLPQIKKLAKQSHIKENTVGNSIAEQLISCPKCKSLNPKTSVDCFKCGIVFDKYSPTGERPSLIRAWKDLFMDYASVTKHLSFVDRCEELHALPFALKKYQQLREAQPQDPLAHDMYRSVMLKMIGATAGKASQWSQKSGLQKALDKIAEAVPWARLIRMMPVSLCLLFIVAGLTKWGTPNLAGAGVALLALILGLQLFFRGRLHWHDFWY